MVCSKKFQSLARVHLFIQQKSTEYLLCAKHCVRVKDTKKKRCGLYSEGAHSSAEESRGLEIKMG